MALYPPIDVLVLPKSVLAKYGNEIRDARGRLSIVKSRKEELFRAQLAEMFDVRYPDLAGITVRFGEPYLHDAPHHEGGFPVHSAAEHIKLMQILREEVSVKRNHWVISRI